MFQQIRLKLCRQQTQRKYLQIFTTRKFSQFCPRRHKRGERLVSSIPITPFYSAFFVIHRWSHCHCCFVLAVNCWETPNSQTLSCLGAQRPVEVHAAVDCNIDCNQLESIVWKLRAINTDWLSNLTNDNLTQKWNGRENCSSHMFIYVHHWISVFLIKFPFLFLFLPFDRSCV